MEAFNTRRQASKEEIVARAQEANKMKQLGTGGRERTLGVVSLNSNDT